MKEESNNKLINNNKIDQFDNESIKTPKKNEETNINKENIIKNIKMKKIIQIKNKKEQNIPQIINNELKSNRSIPINLKTNIAQTQNITGINNIYKKNMPKLNEYFNHDKFYDNELYQNYLSLNEQYFLNKINYNRKINQLNIPNQNYPNIITNNNNYYYSILDDFPINMPIYIDNTNLGINQKNNQKLYNIKTIPNYNINSGNYFRNNYFGEREFTNFNPNYNLVSADQIQQANLYNMRNINEFYNKEMIIRNNNYIGNYSPDYLTNRSRFINSRFLSQNAINIRKPIYILPAFKKRARSHEKPFNIIHKYYDGNYIMEEENEEETNMEIKKEYKNEDNENIKKYSISSYNEMKSDWSKLNHIKANDKEEKIPIFDFHDNLNKNECYIKLYGQNKFFNDNSLSSSNVRLIGDYGLNNEITFFPNIKNNYLFHNNISPNNFNLVYERKSIHKKLIINNSPEKIKNNDIKKESEKKEINNKDNATKVEEKTEKEKENIIKLVKSIKNSNKELGKKEENIKKEGDSKSELYIKRKYKKEKIQKRKKINSDKYISFNNSLPTKKSIINKINNKTYKSNNKNEQLLTNNNKNEKNLTYKEKKTKSKNNIFNKIIKSNLKQDSNVNINLNINKEDNIIDEKTNSEMRINNRKNRVFFNHIRVINIDKNKKNNSSKKIKIEKNIPLERSYDSIFSKKKYICDYKRIFKTCNINESLNLLKKKHDLSGASSKKLNKSGNKIFRAAKNTPKKIKKDKDKKFQTKKKIIIDKNLKSFANSSDNIIKNTNINRIKLNMIKKKNNYNYNNKNTEESYTKQYIKKAKSKEQEKEKEKTKANKPKTFYLIDFN